MLRTVTFYLAADRPAIIAPVWQNHAGIYYGQAEPLVLEDWRDEEKLTPALRSAIEQSTTVDCNLRDAKWSDWPAYRASGMRSVRIVILSKAKDLFLTKEPHNPGAPSSRRLHRR